MLMPECLGPRSFEVFQGLPDAHQDEIAGRSSAVISELYRLEKSPHSIHTPRKKYNFWSQAIPPIRSMAWEDFGLARKSQFPGFDPEHRAKIVDVAEGIAKIMAKKIGFRGDYTERLVPLAIQLSGLHASILATPELLHGNTEPLESAATQIRSNFLLAQAPYWGQAPVGVLALRTRRARHI